MKQRGVKKKVTIHSVRRAVQAGIAGFFILLPVLNENGFDVIWGNFLNIHVGGLTFSDPLAVLQVIVKNRYLPVGLLISAGMVLAIAACLGTVFCSWICPFGWLSELANRLARRIRPGKINRANIRNNGFKIKALVFCAAFFIFWVFFRTPILNRVSLPFQYSTIFQYLFVRHHLSGAIWFIGAILTAEVVFRTRFWCRWVCPQSVLLAVAKQVNPFRLKVVFEPGRCVGCTTPVPCQSACSLDLDPRPLNAGIETECTNCGDCVDACRKKGGALGFTFGRGPGRKLSQAFNDKALL